MPYLSEAAKHGLILDAGRAWYFGLSEPVPLDPKKPLPGPAKESKVNLTHATVTFAFYRRHRMAECRRCFCPTVGDMPLLSRNSHHARRCRGGLIARPFFHVSWSAASLVNTVHRRYQPENGRRERHRVGPDGLFATFSTGPAARSGRPTHGPCVPFSIYPY
jgi:hypothetical protein